eukprot:GHVU01208689.1.p1 GENE.GHVU01208689.1~~GHVU01208689.1.p1  ORF type:complete len:218 (-),score=14.92 GHVU01208689.1:636-1289(-)
MPRLSIDAPSEEGECSSSSEGETTSQEERDNLQECVEPSSQRAKRRLCHENLVHETRKEAKLDDLVTTLANGKGHSDRVVDHDRGRHDRPADLYFPLSDWTDGELEADLEERLFELRYLKGDGKTMKGASNVSRGNRSGVRYFDIPELRKNQDVPIDEATSRDLESRCSFCCQSECYAAKDIRKQCKGKLSSAYIAVPWIPTMAVRFSRGSNFFSHC